LLIDDISKEIQSFAMSRAIGQQQGLYTFEEMNLRGIQNVALNLASSPLREPFPWRGFTFPWLKPQIIMGEEERA
jgi:hypothetical protein